MDKKGSGKVRADFSEYSFPQNALFAFSPYQLFILQANEQFEGVTLNFYPDLFCIHKHHQEVTCNGYPGNHFIYTSHQLSGK